LEEVHQPLRHHHRFMHLLPQIKIHRERTNGSPQVLLLQSPHQL
jgi:hypothetical protein